MSHKIDNEVVRDCHSDIRLNMSAVTFDQLRYMISFSVKFLRLIEGENSTEFKTAIHWQNQLKSVFDLYESSYRPNSDVTLPISSILHTFYY